VPGAAGQGRRARAAARREGGWHLEPVDGGRHTHAVYRFKMELGGSLPMWMARGRAAKDVPALFEAIRAQTRYYH